MLPYFRSRRKIPLDKLDWTNYYGSMDTQEFSQSIEDYLETILLQIDESGGNKGARISDIAKKLKVKKPSVVRAIEELKQKGLVEHKPYGKVFLTPEGERTAADVYERHKLLLCFFHHFLGVALETAEEDACAIEHYISRESLKKLREFMEKHNELKMKTI